MFKTYNVADSLGQMNLFMALQVYRNLSNFTYLATPAAAEDEAEEEPEESPRLARKQDALV